MIRVALVDDQSLVRAGFGSLLDAEDDMEVVSEAADGEEAAQLVRRTRPDVVLMDIRISPIVGIEATKRIPLDPSLSPVHVIILTTFEHDEYVFKGLRAGAVGFLVKGADAAELVKAVQVVAAGEALLSPTITRRLIAEFSSRSRAVRDAPNANTLTARERELVALIATGLSNDEIAGQLYVSVPTAKTHANLAMSKLGARDRAQLVIFAYESRLV